MFKYNVAMDLQRTTLRNALKYLNEVTCSIVKKYQADNVLIYIYRPKTKLFNLLIRMGENMLPAKYKTLKLGLEIPDSIMSRKSPLVMTNKKRFNFFSPLRGSLVVVPIFTGKIFSGILLFHFIKKRYNAKILSNIAKESDFIGICLNGFDVLKSLYEEIVGLRVVDDINRIVATELNLDRLYQRLYEQVKRIVKIKNLRIDLFEPEMHCMKPVFFVYNGKPLYDHPNTHLKNSAIFSQIFKKRKIMLISEYNRLLRKIDRSILNSEMEISSFIALPLIVRDSFLGVLMCWDKHKKNIFTPYIVHLLNLMAGQSAIAIYNAKLFTQLNKAINDLTLLYQIEYHISSILSREELLKTAISLIDSTLENVITTILLPDEKNEKLIVEAISPGVTIKPGFESVPLYRGIVGEAMKRKRNVYVPDVSNDEHYVPAIDNIGSELAIPLMAKTRILGVIDFQSKKKNRFDVMTIDLLDDIAHRIATFLENALLYEKIEKSYTDTIRALVLAMEAKDSYTRGHSERVTELALKLAERMGLFDGRKKILYYAGLLHDIGKIAISESILNKPDRLDEFEFAEIKRHPVEGAKMLEGIEELKEVVPIIRHHHENYDGTGYPDRLKGEEIPLESRILAVCDVYDAMTTVRSYRKPFSYNSTLVTIASFNGTKLDPKVVSEFIKMMHSEEKKRR